MSRVFLLVSFVIIAVGAVRCSKDQKIAMASRASTKPISDPRTSARQAANETLRNLLREESGTIASCAERLSAAAAQLALGVGSSAVGESLAYQAGRLRELESDFNNAVRAEEPQDSDTGQKLSERQERLAQLVQKGFNVTDGAVSALDQAFEELRAVNDNVAYLIAGVRSDAVSARSHFGNTPK